MRLTRPRQSRGLHQNARACLSLNLALGLDQRGRVAPGHDLESSDKWGTNRDFAEAWSAEGATLLQGSAGRARTSSPLCFLACSRVQPSDAKEGEKWKDLRKELLVVVDPRPAAGWRTRRRIRRGRGRAVSSS
jgi:hypothetical protein